MRSIEEQVRQVENREERKSQSLTVPVDLWIDSGLEEGGILVIQRDPDLRRSLGNRLRRRGYKVQVVEGGRDALVALRKASFSLMIVNWGIFQSSSELVGMLRKAFPQTRIIITSSNFTWPNENISGARSGMESLEAGAYSYIPDQHINASLMKCVETAMNAKEKACPVLISGLSCNLKCFI